MTLYNYVVDHTDRSACRCGKCIDAPPPEAEKTVDIGHNLKHTVNMYFFDVSARNDPTVEEFTKFTESHKGDFVDINPLDGKEHNYMEIGAWIGDQGVAMQYMALGELLGLWRIMTPAVILNLDDPTQKNLADQMAGMGMISILPNPK